MFAGRRPGSRVSGPSGINALRPAVRVSCGWVCWTRCTRLYSESALLLDHELLYRTLARLKTSTICSHTVLLRKVMRVIVSPECRGGSEVACRSDRASLLIPSCLVLAEDNEFLPRIRSSAPRRPANRSMTMRQKTCGEAISSKRAGRPRTLSVLTVPCARMSVASERDRRVRPRRKSSPSKHRLKRVSRCLPSYNG